MISWSWMEDQGEVLLIGPKSKKSPGQDRVNLLALALAKHLLHTFKMINFIF